MTTSTPSSTRRSAARPAGVVRSSTTLRFPALSRSKNGAGPRRAPSGRPADSTLTTRAPASANTDPHKGPAHNPLRSATTSSDAAPIAGASASLVAR